MFILVTWGSQYNLLQQSEVKPGFSISNEPPGDVMLFIFRSHFEHQEIKQYDIIDHNKKSALTVK